MADDSLPLLHFRIHTDNKFTTFRLSSMMQFEKDVTACMVSYTQLESKCDITHCRQPVVESSKEDIILYWGFLH